MRKESKIRNPVLGTLAAIFIVTACLFFLGPSARAQEIASNGPKGWTAFEQFSATDSDQGQYIFEDSSIGWTFNQYVGVDVGVPYWEVRETFAGQPHVWNTGIGDPYADVRLVFNNHIVNYGTFVTVSVPAVETGAFSTGRLGVDWFNHFDKSFGRVTPFVNGGLTNGLLDTRLLSQPFRLVQSFRTLGFLGNVEGGMGFRVARPLTLGADYYQLFPSGQQKAYNGITNFFLLAPPGVNLDNVTHDRGYSVYARVMVGRYFYIEPAYVHSIKLNDDAATVTLTVDVKSLFTHPQPTVAYQP